MDAFNPSVTPYQTFTTEDGQDLDVRPVRDESGRVLVELRVRESDTREGVSVRLSPGILTRFTNAVVTAGLCAELVNVAAGTPSTLGE